MAAQFLTVPEAGARLGIGRSRSYDLARRGVLPTIRISERRVVVPAAALDRLAEHATETALSRIAALEAGERA